MAANAQGTRSAGGVFLFEDFRDNLIIDRYDTGFLAMRGAKTDSMRSENSEDALTWNVFRSLAQVDPMHWLPRLFRRAFHPSADIQVRSIGVKLWQRPAATCPAFVPKGRRRVGNRRADRNRTDGVVYRSQVSIGCV